MKNKNRSSAADAAFILAVALVFVALVLWAPVVQSV